MCRVARSGHPLPELWKYLFIFSLIPVVYIPIKMEIYSLSWEGSLMSENNSAWVFHSPLQEILVIQAGHLPNCHLGNHVSDQMIMFSQSYREHTQHSDCHTAIPWLQVLYGFSYCSCGYRPLWGKQALESQFTAYHIRVYSSVEIPPLNPRT